MPQRILLITDDNPEPERLCGEEEDFRVMAPLLLVSGIWERCYYVRRSNNEGDELMCIKYDDLKEKIS